MTTTIIIKTEKELRDEARAAAEELGVPLTTVVNALLRQFVRDRKLVLSLEPAPTRAKLALWEGISEEMDKSKAKSFANAGDLISHLKLS